LRIQSLGAFLAGYLATRDQIYLLFRNTKWMIAISLLLSGILLLPDSSKDTINENEPNSLDLSFV
jgi:hypothetical protein